MNWQTITAVFLLLLSAFITLNLGRYAWRQRELQWATPFAVTMLALSIWSFFYGLELVSATLDAKTRWAQWQYIGIAIIPIGWFLFALSYSGREQWLEQRRVILLAIIPAFTVLMAFTNATHHLLWTEIALNSNGPFAIFDASYGPAWFLFFAYSYTLLLIGSVMLVFSFSRFPTTYRWQFVILLVSPFLPWLGNALYLTNLSPVPQLDLGPFMFTLSGIIISVGILRLRLFTVVPVARTAVIDSMTEAMIVLDMHNQIIDINPAARLLLSQTKTNPIGQPIAPLLTDWPDLTDRYLTVAEANEEVCIPIQNQEHYFHLRITPIHNNAKRLIGRLVMLNDITSNKQAEEAIAMSRIKTEFFAKVGHELRTPLNGILGLTEMLEYGVYGAVTDEQKEVTGKIIDSTNYLTKLVDDLLQQSQMEANVFSLEICPFMVADLLERLREAVEETAVKQGLSLTTTIAPDVPPILYGDPIRLYQILINLVENGLKFTEKGGITASIYCPDETHWVIQVQDTGIGISPAWQPQIFDAFRQADSSVTRKNNGVGLGLSIVMQLTASMNGRVTLESQESHGSIFTVTLPLIMEEL